MKSIKNLKMYQKVLLLICSTLIISFFNFYYYNYQALKLPKEKMRYSLDLESLEQDHFKFENNTLVNKMETGEIKFNLDNQYVRYIIVNFESPINQFSVSLEAESTNPFGVDKNYSTTQKCYGELKTCGFNINAKTQEIEMKFNENIQIKSIIIDNSLFFNWTTFLFWIVFINLILIVLMFCNFFLQKIHFLALLLSLGMGSLFLVATHGMTSNTFDGQTHFIFYNALNTEKTEADLQYELDNHHISGIVEFGDLDTKIEKKEYTRFINELAKHKINNATKSRNLLQSQRIVYFPIAFVLKIASGMPISYSTCILLARIAQLVLYSVMTMWIVKFMPNYKLLTIYICLCPQMLFFATNFNYDPTVVSSLLLGFSIFANEYSNKEKKINKKNIGIAIATIVLASFAKFVYILLLFLFCLLPKEKFFNKKQKNLFILVIIGIIFSLIITKGYIMLTAKAESSTILALGEISPFQQIRSIFHHPFSFIHLFYSEVILKGFAMMFSPETFGCLSYYGTMTLELSYLIFILIIFLAFVTEKNPVSIKKSNKIIMLCIYFFIICLIWVGMYLCWTPVGANQIDGVQPRYYIPLLLPILYSFSTKNFFNHINEKYLLSVLTILYIFASCIFIFKLVISIYGL